MKKKISIIACTGLCALSLSGCQKVEENVVPTETPVSTDSTEMINPVTMYMSGEELYEATGIDLANDEDVLAALADEPTDAVVWQSIDDLVAEVILEYDDGHSYDFRASKVNTGLESLAGIYGDYVSEEISDGIMLYEIDEDTTVLIYSKEDVNYAVITTGPRDESIQPRTTVEVDSHIMEVATEYAKEVGYIFSDDALTALQEYLDKYGEEGYSDDYIKDVIDMAIDKAKERVAEDDSVQSDVLVAEDFEVEMTLY